MTICIVFLFLDKISSIEILFFIFRRQYKMKKMIVFLFAICLASSLVFTGCSSDNANDDKVGNAAAGEVVELEGQQDQYGWFPHIRLTFDGNKLTEVYFDYVNDTGAKKSQDEEYNSTMKEKTGMTAKDAMNKLRENLIAAQDPTKVDSVTGATQTSTEFITMAKQAYDQYFNGQNSANNYGKGDPTTSADDTNTKTAPDTNNTDTTQYENGGDGTPNSAENTQNTQDTGAATEGQGGAAPTNE